jgi:stage II sporulation protein E
MTRQQVKQIFSQIAKYLFICGVLVVFYFSSIDGDISPFAAGFLFSCVLLPVIKIVPALIYFFIVLAENPTQNGIIDSLVILGIYILFIFVWKAVFAKKAKLENAKIKRLQAALLILFFVLSQGWTVYLSWGSEEAFAKSLVSVFVGCIFAAVLFVSIKAICQKRFNVPWTCDQIICLMAAVVIFALGLSGFDDRYFDIHKFVTIIIIFLGVWFAEPKSAIMVAACFGLGRSFAALNLIYVAIYTLLAISCYAFKARNRVYSVVAVLFTDLVIGFYFGGYIDYDFYSLLPFLLSVAVFMFVPNTIYRYFTFGAGGIGGFLVSKNTINRNTAGISLRMRSLAKVFNEMQNTYRNLTRGSLPAAETAAMLCGDIVGSICANCPNKFVCKKNGSNAKDIDEAITNSLKTALKRGQISLLDISNTLAVKCTRVNTMVGTINKIVSLNRNKEQIISGLDSGKILMANLLAGVSQLCANFADDVCKTVVFDNERAEFVKEELLYKNIIAEDCLITKTGKNEFVVSVLVPRADARNKIIEKIVSHVCGHKMLTDEVVDAETRGFAIVSVRSAPKYTLIFGVSQVSKDMNVSNGDTFSFMRISNAKTLMAICDGMGAGERAMRASTLALSLVENFYKAGFPDEIIMQSVNQLLTFTGQDIFSALDMCVIDLSNGDIDFIKVGAPDGFVKRDREVELIESGALPLGILDDVAPKITRAILTAGDMVVLCSDGIIDSFKGDKAVLAGFINNCESQSPQEVADKVMAEAIRLSRSAVPDDCTVTVARVAAL